MLLSNLFRQSKEFILFFFSIPKIPIFQRKLNGDYHHYLIIEIMMVITITCFCHIFQLEKNLNRSWSWEKKSVKIFFSFQNNNNCWKARIQFNLIRFELKINKQTNKKTFPGISSTITYIILPKCFFFGHFFDYSKKIKKKRFKNSNLISKKKHTAHKYVIGKIDLAK